MRRINSTINTRFISERGVDNANRTYFAYVPLEQLACYAIAESYDGDTDINSAKLAVESVLTAFERNPSLNKLNQYIQYAHDQLTANSVRNRLEAAVTVVVSDYTRIRYACCGNIKFYILSDNAFYEKSKTQSYYQFVADEQGVNLAPLSENKNLLQYLGMSRRPKPLVSKKLQLPEGGTMLFATCNLWEKVHDIEILDAYESSKPEEFIDNIEELYLSSQAKNTIKSYCLSSAFIQKTFKEDTAKKKKRRFIIVLSACLLLAVILITVIIFAVIRSNDRRVISEIEALNREGVRYSAFGNYSRALEQYEMAQGLVDGLNMRNGQYIQEKRMLANTINDRLLLFSRIQAGDEHMDSGQYALAQRAYNSVRNIASNEYELEQEGILDERLEQLRLYFEINDLILLGEMNEISTYYASARQSYDDAAELARELGDLELRKEVLLRIFELEQKRRALVDADISMVRDEEARIEQQLRDEKLNEAWSLRDMARDAKSRNDFLSAKAYYEQARQSYIDLEIRDADYNSLSRELDELEELIRQETQAEGLLAGE